MRVIFEKEEVENMIFSALCNGALQNFRGYNLAVDLKKTNYSKYRAEGDCYEDVLIKALKEGERLYFHDEEGDEDASFSIEEAVERINHNTEFTSRFMQIHEGDDDADDGDILLQVCLYQEVQFG